MRFSLIFHSCCHCHEVWLFKKKGSSSQRWSQRLTFTDVAPCGPPVHPVASSQTCWHTKTAGEQHNTAARMGALSTVPIPPTKAPLTGRLDGPGCDTARVKSERTVMIKSLR